METADKEAERVCVCVCVSSRKASTGVFAVNAELYRCVSTVLSSNGCLGNHKRAGQVF